MNEHDEFHPDLTETREKPGRGAQRCHRPDGPHGAPGGANRRLHLLKKIWMDQTHVAPSTVSGNITTESPKLTRDT